MTSEAELETPCEHAAGPDTLENSAEWYKFRRSGDDTTEEWCKFETQLWPKLGTRNWTLGTGTGIRVTKEKSASFESEIWETHDESDSWTLLEAVERVKLEVEQSRDDPRNGNLSETSAEKEATATAAAATRGLWMAPENELIAETQPNPTQPNSKQKLMKPIA